MCCHGVQVFPVIGASQDPTMDFRMQGFDPSIHHLGKSGISSNFLDRDAGGLQVAACSPAGVDRNPGCRESSGELGEPRLVTNTNQGILNLWVRHRFFLSKVGRPGAGAGS